MEEDQNTSAGSSEPTKYKVRKEGKGLGKDYEIKMATLLCVKCISRGLEDVWMASNTDGTGAFDDIILKIKTIEGDNVTFMIQLKHTDKSKYIVEQQFKATEGDFSLPKYFKDIDSLYEDIAAKKHKIFEDLGIHLGSNIYFILFTNRTLPKSDKEEVTEKNVFWETSCDENVIFLNTRETKDIYKVNTSKLPFEIDLSKAHNYDKVFLFSNQVHINHIDELIEIELKNIVDPYSSTESHISNASITNKFVDFITNWGKGNLGGYYYITKKDVIYKITELVLSEYQIDLRPEKFMSYGSEQLSIWHEIVSNRIVTVVDHSEVVSKFLIQYICSEISKYYPGCIKAWYQKFPNDDQSAFYTNHSDLKTQMLQIIGNNGKISLSAIYKCVWRMGKMPQVLQIQNQNQYRNIMNILKLSNYALKIIIVSETELMNNEEPIRHFETMVDLDKANKELILKQKVDIQGRSSVMLGNLIDEEMFQYIRTADIVHILSGDFTIGAKLEPLLEYFIERTVTRNVIKSEVLQEISDEIFLLQRHPKGLDNHLPIDQSKICDVKDVDFDNLACSIIRIQDNITEEQRLKLRNTRKSIHCLSVYNRNYLQCIWSEGNRNGIERFQVRLEFELKQEILNLFNNTANIISDSPGMGKSVLMDFVAIHGPVHKWILKIHLNEHREYLRSDDCASSFTKASKHLQYFYHASNHASTCNAKLSDAVFQKLTNTKDVIVLLDGFDEIAISYKNQATNIATSLYNEGYHIWLTTRPVMKEHLEQNYMTSAISLNPFSFKDQKQFMQKYFGKLNPMSLTSESHQILNKFVDDLLNAARKNLNDEDSKFTGIPLQTKLLTDVFKSECKNSLSNGVVTLTEDFDLVYLYKKFIEKQTEILCQKHSDSIRDSRLDYKDHQSLFALKTVFPIDHLTYIKKELAQYDADEAEEKRFLLLQLEGVMTISEKFEVTFLHYTYAEYLAAQWLADNMCHKDDTIRELAQGLIQERFQGSYKFVFNIFDKILSKGFPLHIAIINKNLLKARNIMTSNKDSINEIDQGGRSPLHLIALYDAECLQPISPINVLCLPDTDKDIYSLLTTITQTQDDEMLKVIRDNLNCSPLDYALANSSVTLAYRIYTMLQPKTITTNISKLFQNSYNESFENTSWFDMLLRYFVVKDLMLNKKHANTKLVSYIVDIRFFYRPDKFKDLTMLQLVQTCNKECKPHIVIGSNLHYEVVFGSPTTVQELLSTNIAVNHSDLDGYTALHYAVLHEKSDIVEILLSNQATVNKQNKDGNTPLHLAFLSYNETILKSLISQKEIDVNIQNKDGNTVLHLQRQIKDRTDGLTTLQDIVELLYVHGVNDSKKNLKGETALQCAIQNRDHELKIALLSASDYFKVLSGKCNTTLHVAVAQEDRKLAELLITEGEHINEVNEDGDTPMHLALKFGYPEIVELLLDNGASVNAANTNNDTPVHFAVIHGFSNFIRLFTAKGGDINVVNKHGNTPLHLALILVYPEIAKFLIDNNAKINVINKNGDTPLHFALLQKCPEIAHLLIANGADVNAVNKEQNSPIHLAVLLGDLNIVEFLITKCAAINEVNEDGDSPMHLALTLERLEIVELLIAKGARLNTPNKKGDTPMHLITKPGFSKFRELFVTKGGNVNAVNRDGNTPLHLALLHRLLKFAHLLIANNADLKIANRNGETPLHLAVSQRLPTVAALLVNKGADVTVSNTSDNTPLHLALLLKQLKFAEWLIIKNADINIANKNGDTPLHLALLQKEAKFAQWLITKNPDINIANKNGDTPLHLALSCRNPLIAKLLIHKGSSVNAVNKYLNKPIDLAILEGYQDIVDLLTSNTTTQ